MSWQPTLGYPTDPKHPFNKQWTVFNSYDRILLVSGSRKSGKTWGVLHRVVRHLWETPGARVAVFAKSIKLAKDGGVWADFENIVLPEWFASGIGMEYTTRNSKGEWGPVQDSTTRTSLFRVRNFFGGESQLMLFSIDNDDDVAAKVKQKRFSMIYFTELSMFKIKRILTVTLPQLRMPHLNPPPGQPDRAHMWIADTNPDEDEGNRSWIYKEFWTERLKKRDLSDPKDARRAAVYSRMNVIEMFMKDNPYLSQEEKDELEVSCEDDPALYDSYVLGIWGEAGRRLSRHFAKNFIPAVHVVGSDSPEEDGNKIVISPLTTTLHTGWDLGSVNHAAIILQKRLFHYQKTYVSIWDVLDELVYLGEKEDLKNLGMEMVQKMDAIEQRAKRRFNWIHWTDDSAINQWRPSSASYDYQEIMAGSGGKIVMQGVTKPADSVRVRVRILNRLLKRQWIFVAGHCFNVINMLKECKRGDTDKEYVLNDVHKHSFDATTYPIYAESIDELTDLTFSRPPTHREEVDIISV